MALNAVANEANNITSDVFFWGVSAFVLVLIFIDFFIGKDGREKIRDKVGWWWIYVDEKPITGFSSKNATLTKKILLRTFGSKPFSFKRLGSLFLYLLILSICMIVFVFLMRVVIYKLSSVLQFWKWVEEVTPYVLMVISVSFLNEMFYFLMTIKLLEQVEAVSFNFVKIVFFFIFPMFIVPLVWFVSTIEYGVFLRLCINFDSSFLFLFAGHDIAYAAGYLSTYSTLLSMFSFSMFFVAISLLTGFSRLISPLVQIPLARLLQSFYESDKGILALIGGGIGVSAETIHELIKLLTKHG
jgi:hypothetical protein